MVSPKQQRSIVFSRLLFGCLKFFSTFFLCGKRPKPPNNYVFDRFFEMIHQLYQSHARPKCSTPNSLCNHLPAYVSSRPDPTTKHPDCLLCFSHSTGRQFWTAVHKNVYFRTTGSSDLIKEDPPTNRQSAIPHVLSPL